MLPNCKMLVPLLKIDILKDVVVKSESIIFVENKSIIISFTTLNVKKLDTISLNIYFVHKDEIDKKLKERKDFELPGVPMYNFTFENMEKFVASFSCDNNAYKWLYGTSILYNSHNENFIYKQNTHDLPVPCQPIIT